LIKLSEGVISTHLDSRRSVGSLIASQYTKYANTVTRCDGAGWATLPTLFALGRVLLDEKDQTRKPAWGKLARLCDMKSAEMLLRVEVDSRTCGITGQGTCKGVSMLLRTFLSTRSHSLQNHDADYQALINQATSRARLNILKRCFCARFQRC
jgi:hypothetical protein